MTKITWQIPFKVLKPIKVHLETQKEKLEKRKESLEKEDPFADTSRLMDNAAIDTEAAEEVGHERVSALKEEIDKNLDRINRALIRIKAGKYGICSICAKMIDTDRLAVDPTVEHCMECHKKGRVKDKEEN